METKIQNQIDFNNFIYTENNIVIINVKYFKKQKKYDEFIEKMNSFISNTIEKNIREIKSDKLTIFIYLRGYRLKELDYSFIKNMIRIFEEQFPDNLEIVNIFDVNIVIKGIYNILKPILSKETKEKIFFVKSKINK